MIPRVLIEIAVLVILVKAEWNDLRLCQSITKMWFFLLLGVIGATGYYVFTSKHVIHPASYLSVFFKHFDPFT